MSARESFDAVASTDDSQGQFTDWPTLLALSLCVVLGPIIALSQQELVYMVGVWACGRNAVMMHAIPLLSLFVTAGAAWIGYAKWRAAGSGVEDEHGESATRTRFLALLGIALSIFSALVIAAQWLAIFVFDPCMRA
jgi:hypothetical protein